MSSYRTHSAWHRSSATAQLLLGSHDRGVQQPRALEYLKRNADVRSAVDRFRSASEALASYPEVTLEHNEEDRRLDRERIEARKALVSALEKATGRRYG